MGCDALITVGPPTQWSGRWYGAIAVVAAVGMALGPSALAHSGRYAQRNLVSDQPGKAELLDTSLVNAWGWPSGRQPRRGLPTTAQTFRPCTPVR
jgi:hypothetical protein